MGLTLDRRRLWLAARRLFDPPALAVSYCRSFHSLASNIREMFCIIAKCNVSEYGIQQRTDRTCLLQNTSALNPQHPSDRPLRTVPRAPTSILGREGGTGGWLTQTAVESEVRRRNCRCFPVCD